MPGIIVTTLNLDNTYKLSSLQLNCIPETEALAWVGTPTLSMPSFGIVQRAHVCPIPCRKPILTLVLVSSALLPAPPQLSQVPLPISRNHFPARSMHAVPYRANSSQQALLSASSPSSPSLDPVSPLLATHHHSSLSAVPRHSRYVGTKHLNCCGILKTSALATGPH